MDTPETFGESDGESGSAEREIPFWKRMLPGFVRRSFAAKFFLAMLIVVLVVSVVGTLGYLQIQSITEDDAERTLRSSSALQADSVAEWIAGLRTQAVGLTAAPVLDGDDQQAIDRYLTNASSVASSEVVGVHLVDRVSGRIIATTTPEFAGESVADRSPGWQDAISGAATAEVGTSDAAFERQGDLLMAFASETEASDRVLVVGNIGDDVEQLHETRAIVTTRVLNADGHGVFEPRQNTPTSLVDSPAFAAALGGETRILERSSDVLAFAPVEGQAWVVVTEAPKSELYAASRAVGEGVLVLIGATLVSLALVGFLLARSTVVPLSRLRRKARAMEAGDLDVDLSTDREDEIGRLFAAFASMRDALREQIAAANRALERAESSQTELQRQNARLDEFASTVSHDLRNPLNVADGQRELLAMKLAEDEEMDRDDLTHRLAAIGDAHERIEDIIEDVLALARGDETVEDPIEIELSTIVREAWSNVDTRETTLIVEGERTLSADPGRLLRALENLFRNAIEHAGDDVTVTVEATSDGFAISDDGPGIPADVAGSIFDHGYSGTEEGTGLGLSIVRTIATAHGWEVSLDPAYEAGARFVFTGLDEGTAQSDRSEASG